MPDYTPSEEIAYDNGFGAGLGAAEAQLDEFATAIRDALSDLSAFPHVPAKEAIAYIDAVAAKLREVL